MLTFEQIKELIDLVSERQLQSIEIERAGFRVRIDGKTAAPILSTGLADGMRLPAPESTSPVASASPVEEPGGRAAEASAEEVAAQDGLHLVESPIVGTFYTSPSPDAEPYVRAGDRVKKGQVLCIVEAMKLMNEIESDEDGVIEKVFPKNAQPVEFGEPLFAIRAD